MTGHGRVWTIVAALSAFVVVSGLVLGVRTSADPPPGPGTDGQSAPLELQVQGNQVVDGTGRPVRLLGFNSSGAEYACIEGWGIFDHSGPDLTRMPESMVDGMASWQGANAVRLPLNEQCWLGLGVDAAYGGASYQEAIADYVRSLREHGFAVVLDLHRSAPSDGRSLAQEQMPDRDHSLDFWREVATAYRDDIGVVFDLFNEPWPFAEISDRAWRCWRDGGCRLTSRNGGGTYTAAGMGEIVSTIRSTGARNVLAVGGIYWAERLDGWLEYRPTDPLGNLVASFHTYSFNRGCVDETCYDTVLAQVAAEVPLYAGELGPDTTLADDGPCPVTALSTSGFSERILDWLDRHGASYTPWAWNSWGDCYSLITDSNGTPSPVWGRQVRDRLLANA